MFEILNLPGEPAKLTQKLLTETTAPYPLHSYIATVFSH